MFSFHVVNKHDVSNTYLVFVKFVAAQNFESLHEIQFCLSNVEVLVSAPCWCY